MSENKELNDNERRGLPADIDLLIQASKQVVYAQANNLSPYKINNRIENLEKITNRVEKQYIEIINIKNENQQLFSISEQKMNPDS